MTAGATVRIGSVEVKLTRKVILTRAVTGESPVLGLKR